MMRDSLLAREIDKLKEKLLALGGQVERSLARAIAAVETRDVEAAREVIDGDTAIDHMEVDVEEECLKLLALHQPVAIDLRFIVAVLKVNNDLERIGDHAASLAEHVLLIEDRPAAELVFDFPVMARKAQAMLKQSLDALVSQDAELATRVCAADDEIDEINRNMYRAVEREIMRRPELTPVYTNHIGLSRCLERVADLATNIAQDVIYLTTGRIARH
ncbi:MAG: phosphate signaling complex protein PhoU [Proteobacteria bacterium]|jgi:phosphate transport system protein|nr:phosphate signaling complex protein PhoU [Pseudomonadota bacterium]